MKLWIFKLHLIFIVFSFFIGKAIAQNGRYEKRMDQYHSTWSKLIPKYTKIQYAGSMGLISVGTGWDYGKNKQWETDLMLGLVPEYSGGHTRLSFTIKQNLMPWDLSLGSRGFMFEPLACGLYFNTIFGEEFWATEPSRYPSAYYKFSTKVRTNIYVGQRITYEIPADKRIHLSSFTFYYELSSNELYITGAAGNSYLKPTDYLHLSLGMKLQFF